MDNNKSAALNYLWELYTTAQASYMDFSDENYKWVLGVSVLNDLAVQYELVHHTDQPMLLWGIPVEPDYYNTNNVQLWKNVTADLV